MTVQFTSEQLTAIERRDGDLLLDAGAGSGKTSVLVERFARAVREDRVDVGAILTITFTEKAAAELRGRIRARLRALGDDEAARATESAWISTIHAFCARVLRAHALDAGLDPAFVVLEPTEAADISGRAFDDALASVARHRPGADLVAAHGPGPLRTAILAVHDELRSRGQRLPSLPEVAPPPDPAAELAQARELALSAARAAAVELGALPEGSVRVGQALDALERAQSVLGRPVEWPGELAAVAIPARNGAAALKSRACEEYRDALDALRGLSARCLAADARNALNGLLGAYAARYAELKAERSAVDFEDLELIARDLLARPEIGRRYRERFAHVMVDELQDTNRVQMELIDSVAGGRLFMVGDAQQSIYGFRHAEVELFEARGRELGRSGGRASLQTNFRTREEILRVLNAAYAVALGERFRPLRPGRTDEPATDPRVELLIVDKGADWETDGLAAPWRLAEARMLAARLAELVAQGSCTAGDIVVLTRATTDLRAYERALEAAGLPTYVIGGRGYWGHPQVVELVAYLRALANPLDEEALYATLLSPLCGLSLDGVVLVAAGAREELSADDGRALARFEGWFEDERVAAARLGIEELLDRAIERTGYDLQVLALAGGRRRLANVRKLMRLGREWESRAGSDLPGFLRFVELRAGAGSRESEAPVESEGLDAVRLMTIHRAKGLEFPVTCVADLGRGPNYRPELIRISRDGRRLGLRLAAPGTGSRINALDYDALRDEVAEAEAAEERRLFYVAMTRAKERLILSGAAKLDTWERGNSSTPIDWIGTAFVPDLAQRVGDPAFVTELGVRVVFVSDSDSESGVGEGPRRASNVWGAAEPPLPPPPAEVPSPPVGPLGGGAVSSLSYSGLVEWGRCGYRFYVERVLGLPAVATALTTGGAERGRAVHELLQALDFARPVIPDGTADEVGRLVEAFIGSATHARLAGASRLRREQRFAFPLAGGTLITGAFDVLAREAGGLLVVDYKSDRLGGTDPEAAVARDYLVQRTIYALAALRSGADSVEVVHLFLELPDRPAAARFTAADTGRLEAELEALAAGPLAGRFEVAAEPHRGLCSGCPAAGGLCSWPLDTVMRAATDRLF